MKSVVLLKSSIKDQLMKSQYNNGFPFPKPDLYGKCNMFNSAHFMMSDKSECTQMVDLETECTSLLNSDYYASKLWYYLGQQGNADPKQVIPYTPYTGWDADNDKFTYPGIDTKTASASSVYDSSKCTCKNALKEVEYNVEIEAKDAPKGLNLGKKYYTIKAIKARVVLYNKAIGEGDCSDKNKKVGVKQDFNILFHTVKDH